MIKKYIVILLFLLSNIAQAEVRLEIIFSNDEINQGSLQEATLEIETSSLQNFEIQKLKALSPNDTLYFHKLSPLMKSGSSGKYTSEISVVFLKVPESNSLKFSVAEQEVDLSWNDVHVIPTEASKGMIFEAFELPERRKILVWILCGLGIGAIVLIIFIVRKRWKISRDKKRHRQELKEDIFSANTYEEVISVWQRKFYYQEEFPHTAEGFKNLEKTLFKYVFKPHQSETEKTEILKAYRGFINEVQGGFNGV